MQFFRRSRRGQAITALGIGAVLGSVLVALGLWHIGLITLTTSLVLILALLSEGQHKLRAAAARTKTETQRSVLTVASSVAKLVADQKLSLDAIARGPSATPKSDTAQPPMKADRLGELIFEARSKMESNRRTVESIDNWISSVGPRGSQLRRSIIAEIVDALEDPTSRTVLQIGDAESAIWTYEAISRSTNTVESAGFLFISQTDLDEFTAYALLHPQYIELTYGVLPEDPSPAESLAGLVAYEVDLLIVDLGCADQPVDVATRIPSLFWRWLRHQANVLVLDSQRLSPAQAVEFLLKQNLDLVAVAQSGRTFSRKMKRVVT